VLPVPWLRVKKLVELLFIVNVPLEPSVFVMFCATMVLQNKKELAM
jgi:hypothetical protein